MNYSFSAKVLFTEEQLKQLSYLAYSPETRQMVSLLTKYSRKLKKYLDISLYLEFLSTLLVLLIMSFGISIMQAGIRHAALFLTLLLAAQMISVFFKVKSSSYLERYSRIAHELGDNLFNMIFDDYKTSLQDIPDRETLKDMSEKIGLAAESVKAYYTFVLDVTALTAGLAVILVYSVVSGSFLYPYLFFMIAGILLVLGVGVILEGMYSYQKEDQHRKKELFDRNYRDTQPLLTRTVLKFDQSSYEKDLAASSNMLMNFTTVNQILIQVVPIILFLVPVFVLGTFESFIFIITGLFIILKLSRDSNVIWHRAGIIKGRFALLRLSWYLKRIFEYGMEMTPNMYKQFRSEYLKINPSAGAGDRIIWGDLNIEGLTYYSGRDKSRRSIYLDKAVLPYGKISLMVGEYGVGKSLFGRLVTMRYSGFSCDVIRLGDKDLRTFKNLDSALRYLHFSEDRNIFTSYRNVISEYLEQGSLSNVLVRKTFSFNKEEMSAVRDHFEKYKDYYSKVSEHIYELLDEGVFLDAKDNPAKYTGLVSELFRNFSYYKPTDLVLYRLKDGVDQNILAKGLTYAAIAEYLSFKHLKSYVPEATPYFTDIELSKPPVARDLRTRFLYAVDTLMEGLILVVDDPFSNLSLNDAKNVFKDLVRYAKDNNAVVLILDEKVYDEILEDHKGKEVLGKHLTFEDDGFTISVKSKNLE